MAEGQGNGNDSPERDSAGPPAPATGDGPGDATPEADTDPGAGGQAPPEASWLPFKMTSPAEEAGQQATGTQPEPGAAPAPAGQAGPGQPGSGQQPGPGESGSPPYQQTRPLGGLSSPWQAPPGSQPAWGAPQQPWTAPGAQAGQPEPGTPPPGAQPQPGTPPPGAQPEPGQPGYGTPPPYGAPQGAQPGSTQPGYGTPPQPSPAAQPGGQAFYAGQPPYGGQPPYPGQPPYGGQPPYPGQPVYPGQPPHPGQPFYGEQPQAGWQPPGSPVPPLPGQLPGAVPPGGEAHWAPPGGYGQLPPGPPPSRGPASRALVYIVVAVLAAAVGAGAVFALRGAAGQAPGSSTASQAIPPANHGGGTTAGLNATAVARKVQPGLVDITSYVHLQQQVFEGTGMVLTPGGLVLTNNHVIKGSTRIKVRLVTTGTQYTAKVVGTDNSQDVALLRLVGASGLKTVPVGNSDSVRLGTPVVALGNAGGTGGLPTVTSGTITSLNRTIHASDAGSGSTETLHNMFQTNAAIGEGDSGGALANAAGQVIAMNTAANSQNTGASGTSQGFSIPINRALSITRLMAAGHASRTIQLGRPPFLGIAIATNGHGGTSNATSPRTQLQQFEIIARRNFGAVNSSGQCLPNANANPVPNAIAPAKSGALIGAVFCYEPAATAGAQAGDVITAVNGHAVTSAASLHNVIRAYKPGDSVTLTLVQPSGQQQTLSIKLGAGPAA